MRQEGPSWGIVSTIRAPLPDILRFAAYHLDLGAHRLYLFLDEPNRHAVRVLRRHPKIEIRVCTDEFWQRRDIERPEKHQVRQSKNASFIYGRCDLDWLAHIDVDEFLWAAAPIPGLLRDVPQDIPAVRVRPVEALAGGGDLYKAFVPAGPNRQELMETIYPNFGAFLPSGFLSHVQGKLFVRTGIQHLKDRIHNIAVENEIVPCKNELPQVNLCHHHAPDWDHWYAHYRFRLERGSYKPGMAPNVPHERGGMNKHELLSWIEAEQGIDGLRAFFDEMSATDSGVRARLKSHDMILHRPLHLDEKVAKHFPGSC